MTAAITVIIADEQYLIRLALRHILAGAPEVEILAEVSNREELEKALGESNPRLIIIDYAQEASFGTDVLSFLRDAAPQAGILVVSADDNKQKIGEVLSFGVQSFLTKSCDEEEIRDAIKATHNGEKFFCNRVIDYLLERSFPQQLKSSCAPTPLSPREIEIVQLIGSGLITKEIASKLHLSTHTIYTHRKNIMKKLGVKSSSELVLYAVEHGLVTAREN